MNGSAILDQAIAGDTTAIGENFSQMIEALLWNMDRQRQPGEVVALPDTILQLRDRVAWATDDEVPQKAVPGVLSEIGQKVFAKAQREGDRLVVYLCERATVAPSGLTRDGQTMGGARVTGSSYVWVSLPAKAARAWAVAPAL